MNDMTRQAGKMAWALVLAGAAAGGFLAGVSVSMLWGWG